jgi:hypothetical protein
MYTTTLGSYDMIIGMNWLESHEAVLDCKGKMIYFIDNSWHKIILAGSNRGVFFIFISMMQLKKLPRKGFKLYVVTHMNKKQDMVNIVQHPLFSEFLTCFQKSYYMLGDLNPWKTHLGTSLQLKEPLISKMVGNKRNTINTINYDIFTHCCLIKFYYCDFWIHLVMK